MKHISSSRMPRQPSHAEHTVSEKLSLICCDILLAYFDIDAYPSDILGKMKTREIRRVNEELKALIYNTTGPTYAMNQRILPILLISCWYRFNFDKASCLQIYKPVGGLLYNR